MKMRKHHHKTLSAVNTVIYTHRPKNPASPLGERHAPPPRGSDPRWYPTPHGGGTPGPLGPQGCHKADFWTSDDTLGMSGNQAILRPYPTSSIIAHSQTTGSVYLNAIAVPVDGSGRYRSPTNDIDDHGPQSPVPVTDYPRGQTMEKTLEGI